MKITKLLLTSLLVSAMPSSFAQEQIIPKPVEITVGAEFPLFLDDESCIIVEGGNKPFFDRALQMQQILSDGTGLKLPVYAKAQAPEKVNPARCIFIKKDVALADKGDEAYSIAASPKGIVIGAPNPKGIFYACQSVIQMLPVDFHDSGANKASVKWTLADKSFSIVDYPRFEWRAFALDEARYFFGAQTVKQLIDQMALLKMNTLHWDLTNDGGWRIEIKRYPRLTSVGSKRKDTEIGTWGSGKYSGKPHEGFYTQEQIKDIVRYAAQRNITIVPVVNMPGHASAATAAYPDLSLKPLKEVPRTFVTNTAFDPTQEKTYEFLSNVLDEVVAIFPGKIIHLGGDEVRYNDQWKGVPEIEAFMKKNNFTALGDVQMYFSNKMSEIVAKKGRRMMGWNEICGHDVNNDGGGETAGRLDPNAVVQFWKGSANLAKEAIIAGHDVINSTHTSTYLDYSYSSISLEKAYGFEPVFGGLDPKYHGKVKGLSCQMWTEWVPNTEKMHYQAFPRTCAYAEVGWSPKESKNFADFCKRLNGYLPRLDLMGIKYAQNVVPEISASDFFNTPKAGSWSPGSVNESGEKNFNVTDRVKTPGKYVVTFLYEKGKMGIDIASATLYEDDREISRDAHEGFSGGDKRNIRYSLDVPVVKEGAVYTLKADFKGSGGNDSHGTIYIETP